MHSRSFVLAAASTILIATAAAADVPVNFAYRDAKGNIHDFHFDGKVWQKLQLNNGGMTAAPVAVSDPSAFAVGEASIFSFSFSGWDLPADLRDFGYVGENGDIHRIFHHGGKWAHETLNNAGVTSAPPAAGRVAATPVNRRQLTYTYRDKDGNIQHIASHEGIWHAYRLNNGGSTSASLAAGDPAVLEGKEGSLEVVYQDPAGGLQHLHWGHGGWKTEQLNLGGATEAPAAVGNPVLLQGREHQMHCAYRDINGNLQHIYSVQSKWSHDQLNNGGTTAAPLAAADPAGTVRQDGQVDYVYRDQEGSLQHLFLKENRWGSEKLNEGGLSSAPFAARGPWIRQAAGSGGEALQVFYLDGQGNLQHLSGPQGKWSSEVVNTGAHVTMALPAGGLNFY
ncbi:MAG: hypothetical protein ABSH53_09365 [Holophaga sp.]|jgi:hypothetical protein